MYTDLLVCDITLISRVFDIFDKTFLLTGKPGHGYRQMLVPNRCQISKRMRSVYHNWLYLSKLKSDFTNLISKPVRNEKFCEWAFHLLFCSDEMKEFIWLPFLWLWQQFQVSLLWLSWKMTCVWIFGLSLPQEKIENEHESRNPPTPPKAYS